MSVVSFLKIRMIKFKTKTFIQKDLFMIEHQLQLTTDSIGKAFPNHKPLLQSINWNHFFVKHSKKTNISSGIVYLGSG